MFVLYIFGEFICKDILSWTFICRSFFFLTDSVLLLTIGLIRLSVSSWLNLERLFLETCPFFLGFPVCWHITDHIIFLWFFLYLCGIFYYFSTFTSYFVDLGPLSFLMVSLVNQFCLSFQWSALDFFFIFSVFFFWPLYYLLLLFPLWCLLLLLLSSSCLFWSLFFLLFLLPFFKGCTWGIWRFSG